MIKPEGYDLAATKLDGMSKVPQGAYKFTIARVETGNAKSSGAPRLTIKADIADGNYANTFVEMSMERNKDFLLHFGYNLEVFTGSESVIIQYNSQHRSMV